MKNEVNKDTEQQAPARALSDFPEFARSKDVRISTAEWLNFLSVIEEVSKDPSALGNSLFDTVKALALTTLVKNKADIEPFLDAFDEFFSDLHHAKYEKQEKEEISEQTAQSVGQAAIKTAETQDREEVEENDVETEQKESLGVQEAMENGLDLPESEHDDNESIHGGNVDQHNDILTKKDRNKLGGGDIKEQKKIENTDSSKRSEQESDEETKNVGHRHNENAEENDQHAAGGRQKERTEFGEPNGGIGNSETVKPQEDWMREASIIFESPDDLRLGRSIKTTSYDRRKRYEVRPNSTNITEIVKRLRKIISDVSEIASGRLDVDATIDHFAKKELAFEYEAEREKEPETVLFVDVGGPVDEWRPLIEELTKGMSRGLSKLEIYLFHNQLYGYCWDPKDGNFAKKNGLKSVKDIVKKRKKVIIYGDAWMAGSEVNYDSYPPSENSERIRRYQMKGLDCLSYIKNNSDGTVWINPIFRKYWDDYSNKRIRDVIPMFDLSVGGVEDAIKYLVKK